MINKSNGIGLKNILNRSKLIGADTKIKSAPGEGTTVSISLITT